MGASLIGTPVPATRLHMVRNGIVAGMPIMLGYLPVALTYGVLAGRSGMTMVELTLMSVLVFAGAAQFLAVGMVASGTGIIEIILATFVLNFRHFIMSFSFVNRLKGIAVKAKLPMALGLTDETFAMSSLYKDPADERHGAYFYASLILTAYVSWVAGSFFGGVLGDVMPERLSDSMGIALYAMFIGLLIPSLKGSVRVASIAGAAMLINFICQSFEMSEGWSIVLGTVLGGFLGIWMPDEEGGEGK